jgi:hypothetical protein
MRNSHRNPNEEAPAVRGPDSYPDVPYPCGVSREPVTPGVRKGMWTVDPEPEPSADRAEGVLAALILGAAGIVEQLERGEADRIDPEGDVTALGVSRETNRLTGKGGVIVRRLLPGQRYSRPLAEVLSDTGELDDSSRNHFNWLGRGAGNRALEIWVHDDRRSPGSHPAAFAIVRQEEDDNRFWYLARLLVTPQEIAQWSNRDVEIGSRLVQ